MVTNVGDMIRVEEAIGFSDGVLINRRKNENTIQFSDTEHKIINDAELFKSKLIQDNKKYFAETFCNLKYIDFVLADNSYILIKNIYYSPLLDNTGELNISLSKINMNSLHKIYTFKIKEIDETLYFVVNCYDNFNCTSIDIFTKKIKTQIDLKKLSSFYNRSIKAFKNSKVYKDIEDNMLSRIDKDER